MTCTKPYVTHSWLVSKEQCGTHARWGEARERANAVSEKELKAQYTGKTHRGGSGGGGGRGGGAGIGASYHGATRDDGDHASKRARGASPPVSSRNTADGGVGFGDARKQASATREALQPPRSHSRSHSPAKGDGSVQASSSRWSEFMVKIPLRHTLPCPEGRHSKNGLVNQLGFVLII